MKKCWICGNKNLSDEHKMKSSDLRRNYGKKYKGKNELLYFSGENQGTELKDYKDDLLKFKKCICVNCNTTFTKPHDDAYDKFIKYISINYDKIYHERRIDFEDIYKVDYIFEKRNLLKYYAKHSGCKIVTATTPSDITDLSDFIKMIKHQNDLNYIFN